MSKHHRRAHSRVGRGTLSGHPNAQAVSAAMSRQSKSVARGVPRSDLPVSEIIDPRVEPVYGDSAAALRDAIEKLPSKMRLVIIERYIRGKFLYQAGDILGVSKERARQLESNGLHRLFQMIEEGRRMDAPLDRGAPIPGSAYYRDYCPRCNAPMRVARNRIGDNNYCEDCDPPHIGVGRHRGSAIGSDYRDSRGKYVDGMGPDVA
jgi:hypothetical protein